MTMRTILAAVAAAALTLGTTACGGDESDASPTDGLSGAIRIDGSSTVFPFAEAAGELFNEENPDVQVTVGQSGTGGGFEKFCAGETDIANASRPIKDDEEAPVCERAGVQYGEVQVANDGIAVVTNKSLAIDCLTVDRLKDIWGPRSANSDYTLFGPGTDSGTFDFFTDVINGEEGASREDYEASEDDNQLVTGVAGTGNGLGYFGFSYYEQNQDKLNLVGVGEDEASCVKPSTASIQDGSYKPLSRPLFMYPSQKAMARPEVKAFLDFVIANQRQIAEAAQIVPLTEAQAGEAKREVEALAGG